MKKHLFSVLALGVSVCFPLSAGAGTIMDADFESSAYTIGSAVPTVDSSHSPSLAWVMIGTSSVAGVWNVVASTLAGGAKGFQSAPGTTPAGVLEIMETSLIQGQSAGSGGMKTGWAEFWWKDATPLAQSSRFSIGTFNNSTGVLTERRYGLFEGLRGPGSATGAWGLKNTVLVSGAFPATWTRDVEYYIEMTWDATANPPLFKIRKIVVNPQTTPVSIGTTPISCEADQSSGLDTTVRNVGIVCEYTGGQTTVIQIGKIRVGNGTAPLAPGEAAAPNRADGWESYK